MGHPERAGRCCSAAAKSIDHPNCRFLKRGIQIMRRDRILIGIAILLAGSAVPAQGAVPAFPGAEGFGAMTPGGRGGKVVIVSNLNDSGPGSFRAACENTPGPRIVVFAVSGLIDLQTSIEIKEPKITIAAQTAPGEGIC